MNNFFREKTVGLAKFCGKIALANAVAILATSFVVSFYYCISNTQPTLNGSPFDHYKAYSCYCESREGHSYGKFDSNGFNNLYCLEKNIELMPLENKQTNKQTNKLHSLLIGSSETEGTHVPTDKNCVYLINKKFESNGQFLLYNASFSGKHLMKVANTYEEGLTYFHPEHYALIETRSLPTYSQLKNVDVPKRITNSSGNKASTFILEHICSVRMVIININDALKRSKNRSNNRDVKNEWNEENDVYLRDFLRRFSEPSRIRNVQPILFYHPHFTLHTDGSASLDVDSKDVELWRTECEKQGIVFVYLGDHFMREYEENNILPYGFWNTLPNVGHLNKNGHRMIAEELCRVIERLEEEKKENVQ